MKTAIEWLEEQMKTWGDLPRWMRDDIVQQAKEMEKQQIIEAYNQGDMVGRSAIVRQLKPNDKVVLKYPEISAEQYYNKTFKSE